MKLIKKNTNHFIVVDDTAPIEDGDYVLGGDGGFYQVTRKGAEGRDYSKIIYSTHALLGVFPLRLEQIKELTAESKLDEAVGLIQYFINRVEEGTIRSRTTYGKYKDFINSLQITEWDVEVVDGELNLKL